MVQMDQFVRSMIYYVSELKNTSRATLNNFLVDNESL